MLTFIPVRAAAASAVIPIFFSLGLQAALAHAQTSFRSPVMRPGFVHSHGRTLGWPNTGRQSWTWRSQNRWSRNGWFSNSGRVLRLGLLVLALWIRRCGQRRQR